MSDYKETAVANVTKECFANQKEGSGFVEFIVKQLSSELAERIMGILDREEEIIVRQSDLHVSEFMPTNSVEFRRQIKWSPLVRCKDCKFYATGWCKRWLEWSDDDNGFCSRGERKEDDKG